MPQDCMHGNAILCGYWIVIASSACAIPRHLNKEEKSKLSCFLKQCSSIGLGKTTQYVT